MKSNNLNLIFAIVFLVGFFFVWETLVMKRYAPKPGPAPVTQTAATSTSTVASPIQSKQAGFEKLKIDQTETTVPFSTADSEIIIETRGGAVSSWRIKEKDHWLELVLPKAERKHTPLETFPELNFRADKKSTNEVQLTGQLPSGVIVQKNLVLLTDPPFHSLSLSFKNPTSVQQSVQTMLGWGDGLNKIMPGGDKVSHAEMRAVGLADRVRQWKPGIIFNRSVDLINQGPFKWVGVDNNHFLVAFIATLNEIPQVKIQTDRNTAPFVGIPLDVILKPGETKTFTYNLYVGPKAYSILLKEDYELWRAVNFGFFGVIAKLLLRSLTFFESLTGNYGWAIILLTLCIQILVFPLTRKSLQHTAKMKVLQPHLKKIQDQHKSDPKRMQIETLNFYKKNGMKLMGMEGCLPIMLQIPIFIAFYATLNAAYELRGAPWIFWIKDLGVHDPIYVLPILMGIGMFFQQKLTAAPAADPAQAKMMMFMPVIFTVMFLKLPAGLVLYWCVNSLVTITVQQIMLKRMPAHEAVV